MLLGRAAALAAFAACAFAQADAPLIRVDVRQVLVPVIVTDSKGHHITGLKASDFTISEDGAPQEIAAFSVNTAPAALAMLSPDAPQQGHAPAATAAVSGAPLRHTFVICLDAMHSAFANSNRVHEALTQLFQKEKPAEAQYVLISLDRQIHMLQTATGDPAVLLSALRKPGFERMLGGAGAANLASELNDLKSRMYDFCKRCPACGTRSDYHACDGEIQNLKASVDAQAERWGQQTDAFLGQLERVVEELGKLPTARSVVLVSDGFAVRPMLEFYGVVGAFLPDDPRFKLPASNDLEPGLEHVVKAAQALNVRIYSIDSRGLAQPSFASSGSLDASNPSDRSAPSVIRTGTSASRSGGLYTDMDRQASSVEFQVAGGMEELAHSTGGVFYHESNDLGKQFRAALADGREYYLLAYTSKNAARDGKFRKIEVGLRDRKLHVRAKAGYWAEAAENASH